MKIKLKNIIIVALILVILAVLAIVTCKIFYHLSLLSSTTGIIVKIDDDIRTDMLGVDTYERKNNANCNYNC